MNAKTPPEHTVEFYTTPSLTLACRSAARRNKGLARFAGMHELGLGIVGADPAKRVRDVETVVLSHVDEDHSVLADKRVRSLVSGAFHLLFTRPTTHPDQIALWMRATRIRAESRLHVVRGDDVGGLRLSQLLGRVCFAFGPNSNRGGIIDAYLAGDSLAVRGPRHRLLHVPLRSVPSLRGRPNAVLQNFEIDPDGSFIHWPDLDVHLGWNQFLQAVNPDELRKAQQRGAGFNKRYGAAIREVREEAGIPQSRVEGLTDRQLRRIEQGECRATIGALGALAKAHSLDVNAYMERLTKAMV